jgi:formylglycine-generating enzyme required for sulfatase activity
MVVVPAGSFMMGSTQAERDWAVTMGGEPEWYEREKPRHRVTIATSFAVGRHEVTRGTFAAFVTESGYSTETGCWYWDTDKDKWAEDEEGELVSTTLQSVDLRPRSAATRPGQRSGFA